MNRNIQTDLKGDPHGYPDFTLPVSVIAQVVETLKVDIVAQSIGKLDVNIASSAITLNINISAQSIALNIYTSSGYKANVGTGLITKFANFAWNIVPGGLATIVDVSGKGRCISIGGKFYTGTIFAARFATLRVYADGVLVYEADLDKLDYINGRQMSYALRTGTPNTPVWASAPLLSPDGGLVAAYGFVSDRNNSTGLERIGCREAYAIARPNVEFNSTMKVELYNAGNDTLVFYVGVEYGLYQ